MARDKNGLVLRLQDGLHFKANTASGFELDIDSTLTPNERLAGPKPMELQLVALAGCTAMDVISILRKMRQDVSSYEVRVANKRQQEHPKVYTSVELLHEVRGKELSEANVRRAIELSMSRYCPVFAMLYPQVDITERYELIDDDSGEVTEGEATLQPLASQAG